MTDFPIVIFHNPACGTSRNTLAMIRAAGYEPEVVEYLTTGWTLEQLQHLLASMDARPRDILRDKGTPAEELGLLREAATDAELLQAMVAHPILVNRPIVITHLGTKLCRPSEVVLDLLDRRPEAFTKKMARSSASSCRREPPLAKPACFPTETSMNANNPPIQGEEPVSNRQSGRILGESDPAAHGVVASGDRREDVHFEPDPDQLVVARHLVRPEGPLPPQEHSAAAPVADADVPPIEDVKVAPGGSSVWDARPPADDAEKSGNPTGH